MAMLKIAGKLYRLVGPEDLTLDDYLQFELQTREYGMPMTIGQVVVARSELDGLDLVESLKHPMAHACSAATIWMCRRAAGDDVTFADAVKIPVAEVEQVDEPEDHKPGKAKAAKKPQKSSTSTDSGQDDDPGLKSA